MTKLDKMVKDMIEHANNAGTEVKEKEYVSIFHFYDELNKK